LSPVVSQGIKETHKSAGTEAGIARGKLVNNQLNQLFNSIVRWPP